MLYLLSILTESPTAVEGLMIELNLVSLHLQVLDVSLCDSTQICINFVTDNLELFMDVCIDVRLVAYFLVLYSCIGPSFGE